MTDPSSSSFPWASAASRTHSRATNLALHSAAESDRSDVVLSLLKRGADLEEKDKNGWTALNTAAYFGNLEVLVTLLAAGANIEARTSNNGYTALHTAADKHHVPALDLLLRKGADITAVTGKGWTALNIAVYAGHRDVVMMLLDRGANIHATTTRSGWTALHTATERADTSLVLLLLRRGADIKAVTYKGWNALHCGAQGGYPQVVQTLLAEKADVYSTIESTGYTALHLAAEKAHDTILALLLDAGADPLAETKDGRRALDLITAAEKSGFLTLVPHFVERCRQQLQDSGFFAQKGINSYGREIKAAAASDQIALRDFLNDDTTISATYSDSGTLRFVMKNGKTELALLFDIRADVYAATALGWLPLHLAVHRGSEEIVKTLLKLGADVNARIVETDSTALKWAVITNRGGIVRILLEHGANIAKIDKKGWTVLLWAAYYGHNGIVRQLLAHGADIAATSRNQRWTALHLAAENQFEATVRILLDGGADARAQTRDGKRPFDVTPESDTLTRTVLQKATMEAAQADHTREDLTPPLDSGSDLTELHKTRLAPLDMSNAIVPSELLRYLPDVSRERVCNVLSSRSKSPIWVSYKPEEFIERVDDLLDQQAFRLLIEQARTAPLDQNGDKVRFNVLRGAILD